MESVLRIPRIWIHTKKILNQNAGVSIILKGSCSIPFFIFDAFTTYIGDFLMTEADGLRTNGDFLIISK
jgi:hypothetical protein